MRYERVSGVTLLFCSCIACVACGGRLTIPDEGPLQTVDDDAAAADVGHRAGDDAASADASGAPLSSDAGTLRDAARDDATLDATVETGTTDATTLDAPTDSPPACAVGTHFEAGGCLPDDPIAALPSTAPCLNAGVNAMRIDADDDNGMGPPQHTLYVVTDWWGEWQTDVSQEWNVGPYTSIRVINIIDTRVSLYEGWEVDFSTPGHAIEPGTYAPAYTYANSNRQFGLDLGYSGLGFAGVGAFRIDEFAHDGGRLLVLTASFWQHWDGYRGMVRGCIHYVDPTVSDAGTDGGARDAEAD